MSDESKLILQALTGTDRQSIPRPEREERRRAFFKQPKTEEAAAA